MLCLEPANGLVAGDDAGKEALPFRERLTGDDGRVGGEAVLDGVAAGSHFALLRLWSASLASHATSVGGCESGLQGSDVTVFAKFVLEFWGVGLRRNSRIESRLPNVVVSYSADASRRENLSWFCKQGALRLPMTMPIIPLPITGHSTLPEVCAMLFPFFSLPAARRHLPMRSIHLVVWALGAVLIMSACGGDDQHSDATSDDDLAKSMLLAISDFPSGWSEEPSNEESSAFDKCEPSREGRTGRAESGDFSKDRSASVSETVAVFDTPEHARAALETIRSRDVADCVVNVVENGDLNNDKADYSDASVGDLSFPSKGDQSTALRFKIHAKVKGQSGLGSEVDLFVDTVSVLYGRAGFSISASDVSTPYDSDELEQTVSDALSKVKAKLGGSSAASPSKTAQSSRSSSPTQRSTEAPAPSPAAGGQSRESAAPMGQPLTVVGRLEAKVIAANLDAYGAVQAANQFNEPPKPGKRMVLVTLEVANVGTESLNVGFDPSYKLVGTKSVVYEQHDPSCGVIPEDLDGELFTGGRKQGNVCFQADIDDTNLVLIVEMRTKDFNQERKFLAIQ